MLREMHSHSDEAFGLLVLHNELEAWDEMFQKKKENKSGRDLRTNKKYCSSMDGKGFSTEGRLMFECLEITVEELRETTTSKNLETRLKERFGAVNNKEEQREDKCGTAEEQQTRAHLEMMRDIQSQEKNSGNGCD